MGRQSRFHLAVLGVGSALGGFLFAFSRFTLGSALAVAPLTRIQSGPAAGTRGGQAAHTMRTILLCIPQGCLLPRQTAAGNIYFPFTSSSQLIG